MKTKDSSNKCPHCGTSVGIKGGSAYHYGSPIRTCTHCKNTYLDRNYHEIEIDGIQKEDLSARNSLRGALLFGLLAVFLIAANVYFISRGRVRVPSLIFAVLAVILFFFSIADAIKIKTGKKQAELDAEHQASIQRLQDPEYARTLAELGYKVPEKYL